MNTFRTRWGRLTAYPTDESDSLADIPKFTFKIEAQAPRTATTPMTSAPINIEFLQKQFEWDIEPFNNIAHKTPGYWIIGRYLDLGSKEFSIQTTEQNIYSGSYAIEIKSLQPMKINLKDLYIEGERESRKIPVDYCKTNQVITVQTTNVTLANFNEFYSENTISKDFSYSIIIPDARNNLTGWPTCTSSNVVFENFAMKQIQIGTDDTTTLLNTCNVCVTDIGKISNLLPIPESTTRDIETADLRLYNIPNVSTGKITIAEFHPGKLGQIHRGIDFQTLNISVFNRSQLYHAQDLGTISAKRGYYSGGMGKYDYKYGYKYGDAPLLDQLCWTPTIGTTASDTIPTAMAGAEYGKININMIHRKKYVKSGSGSVDTSSNNDVRDNLEAANLLFNSTGVTSRDISIARAQEPQNEKSTANKASAEFFFAAGNKSELEQKLTGTTPDRNHQFEERISFLDTSQIRYKDASGEEKSLKERLGFTGTSKSADEDKLKFIFLTEAGASTSEADDTIYVIGVAQIVNERLVNVKRDSSGNIQRYTSEYGTWDYLCDEVLATQKVIAVLQRNNQEKWEIVRIEYVE